MVTSTEKEGFSRRLAEALRRGALADAGPSRVAREFNLRYHGNPVTTQAVRKWITGLAVPGQDKMRVLADWLDVEPQWLRYGEGTPPRPGVKQETAGYRSDPAALVRKYELLNEPHRRMVQEMVIALLRLEGKQ